METEESAVSFSQMTGFAMEAKFILIGEGKMKKRAIVTVLVFILILAMALPAAGFAKGGKGLGPAKAVPDAEFLERAYAMYKEPTPKLEGMMFKQEDILPLIYQRLGSDLFEVKEIGRSYENRPIFQLKYGDGDIPVLLWSQMHGDESTATRALFDIFNFLEGDKDDFKHLRSLIKKNLTLYFIPMLNPDGAERFQRRNAQDIDLNRDAANLDTPEAVVLWEAWNEAQPAFGYNLHDMGATSGVTGTVHPVSLSLLSPAFNELKHVNFVRKAAMQVIAGMNDLIQEDMPGVGRYSDAWGSRYFGDGITMAGTSVILIESAGYRNDPEKVFLRKMNFKAILRGLAEIASGNYESYSVDDYFAIPPNKSNMYSDVVLRDVMIGDSKQDVAVRQNKVLTDNYTDWYFKSSIYRVVDSLSEHYGYNELDANGYIWQAGAIYEPAFASIDDITAADAWQLLREGYYAVRVDNAPASLHHGLPIMVLDADVSIAPEPVQGSEAHFFLTDAGGEIDYAVVNGYLLDLETDPSGSYKNYVRVETEE